MLFTLSSIFDVDFSASQTIISAFMFIIIIYFICLNVSIIQWSVAENMFMILIMAIIIFCGGDDGKQFFVL